MKNEHAGPASPLKEGRKTLPGERYDRQWRVALITSPADNDFLESVTQNAGYHVLVFKDLRQGVGLVEKRLIHTIADF